MLHNFAQQINILNICFQGERGDKKTQISYDNNIPAIGMLSIWTAVQRGAEKDISPFYFARISSHCLQALSSAFLGLIFFNKAFCI